MALTPPHLPVCHGSGPFGSCQPGADRRTQAEVDLLRLDGVGRRWRDQVHRGAVHGAQHVKVFFGQGDGGQVANICQQRMKLGAVSSRVLFGIRTFFSSFFSSFSSSFSAAISSSFPSLVSSFASSLRHQLLQASCDASK